MRLGDPSREPVDGSQPAGDAGPYEIMRGRDPRRGRPGTIRTTGSSRIWSSRRATRAAGSSTSRRSRWPGRSIPRRPPAVLIYQVVNRGNGDVAANADGRHLARQRLAGRRRPDRGESDDLRADREERGRIAGHRPGPRPLLQRAAGTNTVPIRLSSMGSGPPVYPPADLDQRPPR